MRNGEEEEFFRCDLLFIMRHNWKEGGGLYLANEMFKKGKQDRQAGQKRASENLLVIRQAVQRLILLLREHYQELEGCLSSRSPATYL